MKVIALAALVLVSAVPLNAQVIISDDFSNYSPGTTLQGSTTSDGKSSYGGFDDNGEAKYSTTIFTNGGAYTYANPAGGLSYVNLNTDLSTYNEYTLNFGNARLDGGPGLGNYTILQGRATGISLGYGFRLSMNGDGNTDINYVAAEGGALTSMGTYTGGQSFSNLAVHVFGNTQQLFIDGTAYGSAQATQGTFEGAASGLAWATQGGDSYQFFSFDNLSVTVVPVPAPVITITSTSYSANAFTLTWSGTGSLPVTIQRRDALASGQWTTIRQQVTTGQFTDPNTPPGRAFYRVVYP
jgi:hypothetical protein